MSETGLFDREDGVFRQSEELLASGFPSRTAAADAYAALLADYRKLLNQARRLVRISDMMQEDLNRLNNELADLSSQDGLTGLANRRRLDERLDDEWRRAMRGGEPFGLVMIDIDHFKRFNDTYGHAAGDDCLKAVAGALAGILQRPCEFVARYGGEEFMAVLPGTPHSGLLLMAERMRAAVNGLAIPHATSPTADHVTVSLGAASLERVTREAALAALCQTADQALYQAKAAGRNRTADIVMAPDAQPGPGYCACR
ncbi:MAG: diguanylate cyclase [Thermodesulfobacteriota bacterium]